MLPSAALLGWAPGLAVDVVAGFEPLDDPDDPPHAVSSRTSEPRPAAAAKPLLRITTLHSRFSVLWGAPGSIGSSGCDPVPNTPETYQTAASAGGFLAAT